MNICHDYNDMRGGSRVFSWISTRFPSRVLHFVNFLYVNYSCNNKVMKKKYIDILDIEKSNYVSKIFYLCLQKNSRRFADG